MNRMKRRLRSFGLMLSIGFLTTVTAVQAAHAFTPQVEDNGNFFSDQALREAKKQILQMYEKTGYEIEIKTLKSLPENLFSKDREADRLFAQRLAAERNLQGVLLLWIRDIRSLVVQPQQVPVSLFPVIRDVREGMLKQLPPRGKREPTQTEFDAALRTGLDRLNDAFSSRSLQRGSSGAVPTPSRETPKNSYTYDTVPQRERRSTFPLGVVLVVVAGVGLLIWLIARRRSSGPGLGGGPIQSGGTVMGGAPYGAGGSSWVGPALGGVAGAMAGNWLYDRLAHGGEGHAHAESGHVSSSSDWSSQDDVGNATFGGGGSDWGGGDSGGDSDSGNGGDW